MGVKYKSLLINLLKDVGSVSNSPSSEFNLTKALEGEEAGLQPVKPNSERISKQYFL
ncbi:hypothetical protein Fmac_024548 [Flemingia macrophylla]|uniref:Uncharacterized protein n=1 Tax=Flemingia macrophylla TaxID=520843 RepID=A0ABD1LRG7_9FABA